LRTHKQTNKQTNPQNSTLCDNKGPLKLALANQLMMGVKT